MMSHDLQSVALTLVATGKGILAADETTPTLTRRFDALGIRRWRHGMARTRTWLPASTLFISGPSPWRGECRAIYG
jgi:fructose-bisphosphate aldolase class I